ncbi:MAG: hypothetical protein QM539_00440 [Alphaproteobacteria bacterium]|nr:hypothetical protein [Alphaproteobacteria bacterium]
MKKHFKNKLYQLAIFSAIFMALISLNSCEKDPPVEGNHDATSGIILYRYDSTNTILMDSFKLVDPTGNGDLTNVKPDTIRLSANTKYSFQIKLVNVTNSVVTDVTGEIDDLDFEHQFIFTPNPTTAVTINYDDMDSNGLPVGLKTLWKSVAPLGVYNLNLQLRHLPGLKTSNVTQNSIKGTADINVNFPIKITN